MTETTANATEYATCHIGTSKVVHIGRPVDADFNLPGKFVPMCPAGLNTPAAPIKGFATAINSPVTCAYCIRNNQHAIVALSPTAALTKDQVAALRQLVDAGHAGVGGRNGQPAPAKQHIAFLVARGYATCEYGLGMARATDAGYAYFDRYDHRIARYRTIERSVDGGDTWRQVDFDWFDAPAEDEDVDANLGYCRVGAVECDGEDIPERIAEIIASKYRLAERADDTGLLDADPIDYRVRVWIAYPAIRQDGQVTLREPDAEWSTVAIRERERTIAEYAAAGTPFVLSAADVVVGDQVLDDGELATVTEVDLEHGSVVIRYNDGRERTPGVPGSRGVCMLATALEGGSLLKAPAGAASVTAGELARHVRDSGPVDVLTLDGGWLPYVTTHVGRYCCVVTVMTGTGEIALDTNPNTHLTIRPAGGPAPTPREVAPAAVESRVVLGCWLRRYTGWQWLTPNGAWELITGTRQGRYGTWSIATESTSDWCEPADHTATIRPVTDPAERVVQGEINDECKCEWWADSVWTPRVKHEDRVFARYPAADCLVHPPIPARPVTARQAEQAAEILGGERTVAIVGAGGIAAATPEQLATLAVTAAKVLERRLTGGWVDHATGVRHASSCDGVDRSDDPAVAPTRCAGCGDHDEVADNVIARAAGTDVDGIHYEVTLTDEHLVYTYTYPAEQWPGFALRGNGTAAAGRIAYLSELAWYRRPTFDLGAALAADREVETQHTTVDPAPAVTADRYHCRTHGTWWEHNPARTAPERCPDCEALCEHPAAVRLRSGPMRCDGSVVLTAVCEWCGQSVRSVQDADGPADRTGGPWTVADGPEPPPADGVFLVWWREMSHLEHVSYAVRDRRTGEWATIMTVGRLWPVGRNVDRASLPVRLRTTAGELEVPVGGYVQVRPPVRRTDVDYPAVFAVQVHRDGRWQFLVGGESSANSYSLDDLTEMARRIARYWAGAEQAKIKVVVQAVGDLARSHAEVDPEQERARRVDHAEPHVA